LEAKELLKKYGFDQEYTEQAKYQFIYTEFPKPLKRYRVIWESFKISIEEVYFWILQDLRVKWAYPIVDKIQDVFTAAETSAFFGVTQTRVGLSQDKVSTFLATIGKMVKELFQIVREIRIIDERLEYYEDSFKGVESAEITLKGIWIDMVEGGAKVPTSVYGMAREVQFTTLPDLFFSTHPLRHEDVDKVVDTERAQFNRKVREVLKRKLKTFMVWKEKTYKELKIRRSFTIKYLRQHFDIIRMYMDWVRPYLRYIRRLHMDDKKMATPDLITAFEGSMIEIELLFQKLPIDIETGKQNEIYWACILVHFLFRTRPTMTFQAEHYQRGPLHVGRVDLNIRGYIWTKEQIENYKKMRREQDFELLKSISRSIEAAMEALGADLRRYLEEAGEKFEEPKKPEPKKPKLPSVLDPFISVFKGFGELVRPLAPKKPAKPKKDIYMIEKEKALAKKCLYYEMWQSYKYFKKEHKMIAW
jgi:hypothetical protein